MGHYAATAIRPLAPSIDASVRRAAVYIGASSSSVFHSRTGIAIQIIARYMGHVRNLVEQLMHMTK